MSKSDAGKGDSRRPSFIEQEEYEENYDYIFKRDKKNKEVMKRKPKHDEE